ncbi:MAG: pseudouridine synthase, partial [Rikenellaceae bacterium]
FNREDGERRPFNREGGERRPFNREGGERRPFNREGGERRPFNREDRGERRPFNREGGERRPFNREGGERRPFNREGGERRPFNREGGERRPFNREDGERRPFNREGGERRPFNREDGERRPFKKYGDSSNDSRGGNYPTFKDESRPDEMRLNRYIAQGGLCSRREADEFITNGEVTVNGEVVTELGTKVKASDVVMHNGEIIKGEKRVYLLLNKPKGYVTSLDDPHADKTVMDLIANACTERVYPVGRLDKNSLGVLLFTNDGDLTKEITHPSHQKKKIYQVSLDKDLTRADMEEIARGITLEDGEIHADAISYVNDDKSEIGIEIHSGRNRIVRRIFEHLGYSVQKLDRVYFAGLTKKNLKRGQWRFLTTVEVERLKTGRYE